MTEWRIDVIPKVIQFLDEYQYRPTIRGVPEVSKRKGILIGIITFAAAIACFYLAYFLCGNGIGLTALNIFNTLVSEEHTAAWVLHNRGVALLGLKNYVGAISNFNTAITLDPNDEYAFFDRHIRAR